MPPPAPLLRVPAPGTRVWAWRRPKAGGQSPRALQEGAWPLSRSTHRLALHPLPAPRLRAPRLGHWEERGLEPPGREARRRVGTRPGDPPAPQARTPAAGRTDSPQSARMRGPPRCPHPGATPRVRARRGAGAPRRPEPAALPRSWRGACMGESPREPSWPPPSGRGCAAPHERGPRVRVQGGGRAPRGGRATPTRPGRRPSR